MTTAQALEAITDTGKFEILATRVLRLIDPDSSAIEHIGVNAAGKTVKNPVDGFCRVPGSSPPKYVMHQFATTAGDRIRHKWLFKPPVDPNGKSKKSDEGDLAKAARLAAEIRKEIADANFVLWLSTNQPIDAALIAEVEVLAVKAQIEVRFLGQSRLRDALDGTPAGEWIRRELLGIAAKRVSREYLQEFSDRSIKEYAKEFLLVSTQDFVRTKTQQDLVARSEDLCTVVVGHSGSGKSVACFQSLAAHVEGGGAGLWLPAEIVETSLTLAEAITAALQMFNPELTLAAGEDALRLGSLEDQFVFSIDDINRTSSPAALLRKIVRWAKPPPTAVILPGVRRGESSVRCGGNIGPASAIRWAGCLAWVQLTLLQCS